MALTRIKISTDYSDGLIIGHSWRQFGFQNHIQQWVDSSGYQFEQIVIYERDTDSDLHGPYHYFLIGEEEAIVAFKLRWL